MVSGGLKDLSSDTSAQLSGQSLQTTFGGAFASQTVGSFDFSGGTMTGWIGGQVRDLGGTLGQMLVLGPNESTTTTFDMPDGAQTGTISFDFVAGDSLDGEIATITTNGQTVTLARGSRGSVSFTNPDVSGITVTTEILSEGTDLGGRQNRVWNDSLSRVTITVDNPGTSLDLGLRSGADQGIADEFFAIDNVQAAAS